MTRQLRRQVRQQQIMLAHHARSLEQQVQKRTTELEEANARKDKLLNIVSHELKPPLGNLKEMAQLLLRQLEQEDALERVRQGLMDMERFYSANAIISLRSARTGFTSILRESDLLSPSSPQIAPWRSRWIATVFSRR